MARPIWKLCTWAPENQTSDLKLHVDEQEQKRMELKQFQNC